MVMARAGIVVVALAALITACGATQGGGSATGILRIEATVAPTCPVERAGQPPCVAPYNGPVQILDAFGHPVRVVTTDSQGKAELSVPVGTYKLTLPATAPAFPRLLHELTVTVDSSQPTVAQLIFDTGIR